MARTSRPLPVSRQVTLENRRRHCAACGGKASADYQARRNVVTLSGAVALKVQVRVCHREDCPLYLRAIRAEEEGLWVLPDHKFGLDVMALIGALRNLEQRSVPFIHAALRARGIPISERSVTNLIDRYEHLLALRVADSPDIQAVIHKLGRVVLGIGGLPGGRGDEWLWVLRDCLSGVVLAARNLAECSTSALGPLIEEVASALPVPITGVISSGQEGIACAVAAALPGVPHELRQPRACCRSQDATVFSGCPPPAVHLHVSAATAADPRLPHAVHPNEHAPQRPLHRHAPARSAQYPGCGAAATAAQPDL